MITFIFALNQFQFARSQCYYPNGDLAKNSRPCDITNDALTVCCEAGYNCLENKVCQSDEDTNSTTVELGDLERGSCTDKTWKAPGCPKFCYGMYFVNLLN